MYKNNSQNMQRISKVSVADLCQWDDDQTLAELRENLASAVRSIEAEIKATESKFYRAQLGQRKFAIQQILSRVNELTKPKQFHSYFMDAATQILSKEQFREVKQRAYEMSMADQEKRTAELLAFRREMANGEHQERRDD